MTTVKVIAGIIIYMIISILTTMLFLYSERKEGKSAQEVYEGDDFYAICVAGFLFPLTITLIIIMAISKLIKIMCITIVELKIATEEKDEEEDKTEVEPIIEADKESENKKMNNLEKAKEIVKKYYKDADCGIFNSRNVLGDGMITIYKNESLTIDICYNYAYFEVFGLTNEEFRELEKYYGSLEESEKE